MQFQCFLAVETAALSVQIIIKISLNSNYYNSVNYGHERIRFLGDKSFSIKKEDLLIKIVKIVVLKPNFLMGHHRKWEKPVSCNNNSL